MNNLIKVNFKRVSNTLLGLALDGSRLEGAVLRRQNGSLIVLQRFAVSLSLDWSTNEAELVGREILNHLNAAGVRERRCAVVLPLKWALAAHAKIPALAEADVASFLQIEAERGFPTDIASLQVATSRLVSKSGEAHATFIGIPNAQVERLEQILHAAKLKPVTFSLGITALQPAGTKDTEGVLALAVGENHVALQITCGGGVAALRALEGAMESENGERALNGEWIAREARITLGQLPEDLRDAVRRIRIFGPRDQAQRLAEAIRPRFEPGGLKVEIVSVYPPDEFRRAIPPDTTISPAFSLAARQLAGRDDPFEFLPPKVSSWQRLTSRYAPGRLRKAGAIAAGVVFLVVLAFLWQQLKLASLRAKWRAMAPKVNELTSIEQDKIQKYRPWFDPGLPYLAMMRSLAGAFTADGSMTAKTLEIREQTDTRDPESRGVNLISCTGNAENYSAVQQTIKNLGGIPGVTNFNWKISGKSPMQFSFDFQMKKGFQQ